MHAYYLTCRAGTTLARGSSGGRWPLVSSGDVGSQPRATPLTSSLMTGPKSIHAESHREAFQPDGGPEACLPTEDWALNCGL